MNESSMPAPDRSSPQPRWRIGCKSVILVCLLVIALTSVLNWLYQIALRADANRRAPVVVDVEALGCELSPSGRFLWISLDADAGRPSLFLDTRSDESFQVPLPSAIPQYGSNAFWLADDTLFIYSRETARNTGDGASTIFLDGWLLDVATRTVTDVFQLPPTERLSILERATALQHPNRRIIPEPAPNGQYVFQIGGSITDTASRGVNDFPLRSGIERCGWKTDSSGYYFAERPSTSFLFPRYAPGPVRLLLVNPPPGLPAWVWPGLGGALGLVCLGWWWRYRQRGGK